MPAGSVGRLSGEPGLADAGFALDQDEAAAAGLGRAKRSEEPGELFISPDEDSTVDRSGHCSAIIATGPSPTVAAAVAVIASRIRVRARHRSVRVAPWLRPILRAISGPPTPCAARVSAIPDRPG